MPEGPEIRLAADKVFDAIGDGPLVQVQAPWPAMAAHAKALQGQHVLRMDTHGKAMLTRFSGGNTMYSHNQLYGRWYTAKPGKRPSTKRALRVALHTKQGSAFLYSATDVELLTRTQVEEHPFLIKLGPDILDPALNVKTIVNRLKQKQFNKRALGVLYLDQGFLAGNGNYLRSEILFAAGLHPAWRPCDCDEQELKALAKATLKLCRRSYKTRGLTNPPALVTALKKRGWNYGRYRFAVFGRERRACHDCGNKIEKSTMHGRRIYVCNDCQPGP